MNGCENQFVLGTSKQYYSIKPLFNIRFNIFPALITHVTVSAAGNLMFNLKLWGLFASLQPRDLMKGEALHLTVADIR